MSFREFTMFHLDGLSRLDCRSHFSTTARRRGNHALMVPAEISSLEHRCLMSISAVGGETLVNTTLFGHSQFSNLSAPAIAVTGDGTVVAAWTSTTRGHSRVVARRLSADGSPLEGEFQASGPFLRGLRGEAAVEAVGSDYFVVAWDSTGDPRDPSGSGIFARVYFNDGTPVTGVFRVNASIAGNQRDPSIASLSSTQFVVTWSGAGQGQAHSVFAREFRISGSPVSKEILVSQTMTGGKQNPDVINLPSGGFQVAWNVKGAGNTNGIDSRQFNSAGQPVGPEFVVNTATGGIDQQPAMARLGNEEVVFAWQANGDPLDGSGSGIVARRYDINGNPLGGEFPITQTTHGNQSDPSIATLSDGGFAVAWHGAGAADANGIYVREINADGTPRSDETLVNTTVAGVQENPMIRVQGPQGFVVVWDGNVGGAIPGRSSQTVGNKRDAEGIALRQFNNDDLVTFAGYKWYTNYHYNTDSGYFANGQQWAPQNVTVDQAGLHLKLQIATVGGQYTAFSSAEAVLVQTASGQPFVPGFGTYLVSAHTSGSFDRLASNNGAIFGAFTYENLHGVGTISGNSISGLPQSLLNLLKPGMLVTGQDYKGNPLFQEMTTIQGPGQNSTIILSRSAIGSGSHTIYFTDQSLTNGHRELDMIEASRFGLSQATNAQFTLQPYKDDSANVHRITSNDQGDITLVMNWSAAKTPVTFSLYYGIFTMANLPKTPDITWTTADPSQNIFIPNSYDQTVHLNLWRVFWINGLPLPQPDEVIVKNFQYVPA
jgi:hypothetical protein